MKGMKAIGAAALTVAGMSAGGCASDVGGADGTGFKVQVAPLSLPGVTNVCYTLEVRNDMNQVVWRQEGVCADQYGDLKSAITYIGTCDATDNDDSGTNDNTVTVTIEDIWDGNSDAVPDDEWDNPCSFYADGTQVSPNGDGNGPCKQTVPCVENADTEVVFNLTIMRDANQGFFDVAVNFEDIFCSAKVDCQYPGQGPIQLLFNPKKGNVRDNTIVVARACTSGVGDATQIHVMPTYITCGWQNTNGGPYNGLVFMFDPTSGDGNQGASNVMVGNFTTSTRFSGIALAAPYDQFAWQNANYTGEEQLTQGESSIGKIYMNEAIGFDFEAFGQFMYSAGYPIDGCSLITGFTATDSNGFPADGPGMDLYPWANTYGKSGVQAITLWTAGQIGDSGLSPGALRCTQNPLDGSGTSGLQTGYGEVSDVQQWLPLCMTGDGPGNPLTACSTVPGPF